MENVFLVYNAKFKTKSVVKCIFLALKAKNGINSQMYIPRNINDYEKSVQHLVHLIFTDFGLQ